MKIKSIISLILCAALACAPAMSACAAHTSQENADLQPYQSGLYSTSKVGYSAEYLGTTGRTLPLVSDGGLERYPAYGVVLGEASTEEKEAIIAENRTLVAGDSTYDAMDSAGNLYLNGSPTGNRLYKHTAAAGMYEGDVSDGEQAVIKRITYLSRGTYGNMLTGLYAPAGEVITVEMSEEDVQRTGGIKVWIGQLLTNGQQNNIWAARDFNRMPLIGNVMAVEDTCAYVGSYLGGPIYISPNKDCGKFSVTISGAVNYAHYIYGYTTEEEYALTSASSAPYFDLEVWDDGVRHSGPASRAAQFSYANLGEAAVLWDKISCVSNQVPAGSGGSTGITFLYDPFVAAGAMVAFVGRHTVNCPLSVMQAALNAAQAIDNPSGSFWGAIHEYNHHYQKYGYSYSASYGADEVTNNAVSLVEYSLFTRASSYRTLGNAAQGNYADSWNRYTNPAWTLEQNMGSNSSELAGYANLLYSFGAEKYIRATALGAADYGDDGWYSAVSDATGYDMTYYFNTFLGRSVSQAKVAEYAAKNNPVYVPVATIFQTGSGHIAGGKTVFTRTTRPYIIRAGQPFELNLRDNIILPEGFSFTIKQLTQPAAGTLVQKGEGIYEYTPAEDNSLSGEMYLTLSVTADDAAFEVEDVTLILELEPSYVGAPITRTTYLYDSLPYATATEAYDAGFAGYSSVTVSDNSNRVQNGNCEIWEPGYSTGAVMQLLGKVAVPSGGKYRFALRGRYYAALYLSTDGVNYSLAGNLEDAPRTDTYFPSDPSTYTDLELEGGGYVWFKLVLLVTKQDAYIGLGMGKFSGEEVGISHVSGGLNVNYSPLEPYSSDYAFARSYTYGGGELNGGQWLSPDVLSYFGGWSARPCFSTFGHVYECTQGSARFTFTGSRFGIITGGGSGECYDVYVDGRFVQTVSGEGEQGAVWSSPLFNEGVHTVELRSRTFMSVDSVVVM